MTPRPAENVSNAKLGWILAVCCVAQFMVILDLSIVNVALPSIQVSLGFSAINLQWVVDAYAIAFAGFLMLGGRAADHFGQRKTLVAALSVFALASLVGGSAVNQIILIGARAVQGFSGALMAAASLATITSSFAQGPARHRAIGLWGAMNGAGGAAGVLFGGIITQALGWRWVLLINPPIALAATLVAFKFIADRPDGEVRARFDLGGALAMTGGLIVLVYGVVNAGVLGWTAPGALIPIVIGVALLALFPIIERRASDPLVPPRALNAPLRVANAIVLLFSAALFPMWYVSSLYLQQVLGLSPLDAGLVFLPMTLVIMVAARMAGPLVGRFGVRAVLGGGLVMMTSGLVLLARIGTSGSAIGFVVLPGLLVALGIGFSIVPSTIAATQGAVSGHEGLSSGVVNTSRQIGGALGIAFLISIATQYTSHLIGQNRSVAQALTNGFRLAYLIGAGLVAGAALVAFLFVPGPATIRSGTRRHLMVPVSVLVVIAGFVGVDLVAAGAPGAPIGAFVTPGTYQFVSAPTVRPPKIVTNQVTVVKNLAPGFILLANFYNLAIPPMVGPSGPLILNNQLQPVWFKPLSDQVVAANTTLQRYQGRPAIAWWQGVISSTGATVTGEDVVVNQHYQTVATLRGVDGWVITLHSLQIVGDNAWVTANKNVPRNLTAFGGARNGSLVDSAVQEYSLTTGKLIYSWDALEHISLADSYSPPPTNGFPWDAYHVNSIDLVTAGTFLVSMRDTWGAYLVNVHTGKIVWVLGGKHSSFTQSARAQFQWQHNVVLARSSTVTLFDDHCCEITGAGTYLAPTGPSRALVLQLNFTKRTATMVSRYLHRGSSAAYMGSAQTLENGNIFVGWGDLPYFSEYSPSGTMLLDAVLPSPDLTYRAIKIAKWVGVPSAPPSAVARRVDGQTTVFVSWNGSTETARWRVLAGPSAQRLSVVASRTKTSFETAIAVAGLYQVFRVQALDTAGHVLASTASVGLKR